MTLNTFKPRGELKAIFGRENDKKLSCIIFY